MSSARPVLAALDDHYDLVVVGGGITGAGVLREAVRTGAKALLVEQHDFASGTSSWSSKLVHGGLRYLKEGQWRLTLESVRERERLLREAPGLVQPLPFLMPVYPGRGSNRWTLQLGLWLYDRMAGSRKSRFLSPGDAVAVVPELAREGLRGAMAYEDAVTDDARLVLRLVFEATAHGATACNYVRADTVAPGRLLLHDQLDGASREIRATTVINATGAWPAGTAQAPVLRPLRGSHFVFAADRLPLRQAVAWPHPRDGRPMFALPWLGAVLYGTTDLDHDGPLETARMTRAESDYLIEALVAQFPSLSLRANDAIASFAGVRPVLAKGAGAPSAASRESAIWREPGGIGVTGGKLTTFRVTARAVLREAAHAHPALAPVDDGPLFDAAPSTGTADEHDDGSIDGTPFTWQALRHALRHEYVVHLGDLMLRRTRLGLLLPRGGESLLPRLRQACQHALGWDDARWQSERAAYLAHWQRQHAPEPA